MSGRHRVEAGWWRKVFNLIHNGHMADREVAVQESKLEAVKSVAPAVRRQRDLFLAEIEAALARKRAP